MQGISVSQRDNQQSGTDSTDNDPEDSTAGIDLVFDKGSNDKGEGSKKI